MKKYMVFYESLQPADEQMDDSTPEEMEAGMAEWNKWRDEAGDAVVDFGMPLVASKHIENGKVTDGRIKVSGYSIIQAESPEQAVEMLKDHPHFRQPMEGAAIDVLEFMPMPGM